MPERDTAEKRTKRQRRKEGFKRVYTNRKGKKKNQTKKDRKSFRDKRKDVGLLAIIHVHRTSSRRNLDMQMSSVYNTYS
jgi:hypothetical protein